MQKLANDFSASLSEWLQVLEDFYALMTPGPDWRGDSLA